MHLSVIRYSRPSILDRLRHDRHAVIEAGAGTGKTRAIEDIALDLLLATPCTIEEILVVTFTEKATAELRGRIRALLEAIISGTAPTDEASAAETREIDETGRRKLEAALFSFDRAPIYTIHGFCQRILTELAFDTGAGFQLEVVRRPPRFSSRLQICAAGRTCGGESSRGLLAQWLGRGDAAARDNLTDSLEKLLYEAHFHRYLESGALAENQRALARLSESFAVAPLRKAYAGLRQRREPASGAAEKLAKLIAKAGRDHEALRAALSGFDFEPLPHASWVLERNPDPPPATVALLDTIDACRRAMSLEVRIVDSFLPRVEERLAVAKSERREIDYDDMQALVWRAITGPRGDALIASLRDRFRYALVDEFQDTDDLQWRIFRAVFVNSGGRCRLCAVGDPKQAIYGFRGADVFSYLQARDELASGGVETVALTTNFRSTADLVAACNTILDQGAGRPIFSGPILYDKPAECGRPNLRACDAHGNSIVPVTAFRYAPASGAGSVPRMRAAIGRAIASTVRRILTEQAHRIAIEDEDGKRRLVEANDVYILTRTRAESFEIGGYLREVGVPFAFYKQEGLFQTGEAYDVLDVLKAVAEPGGRSARLKAWASPFFAVPFAQLAGIGEPAPGHPLTERLYEWKALAAGERFVELFDRLLHQSGLVGRELFLSNSERELTNYLHILEILLHEALNERLSLLEIISRLESYISDTARPAGINSNVQRIESERRAVQVMTVHMSKGLEADVVFLFGGIGRIQERSQVAIYHRDGERRIAVGGIARELAAEPISIEHQREDQRLTYVALTRARVKLYLPLFPGPSAKKVAGYYDQLNNRLEDLCGGHDSEVARLFEIEQVDDLDCDFSRPTPELQARLKTWRPPQSLTDDQDRTPESFFRHLRGAHAALITSSYTTLERSRAARPDLDVEPEDFKYDLEVASDAADLPGGRNVGIFLHEVIEKLDLASLAEPIDLASWRCREDVAALFAETMRRHQVRDARWADRGAEVVFNALRSRIELPSGVSIGPLYRCPNVREMEFIYPIPERTHPLLAAGRDRAWTVERGYLKGFVDFVFDDDRVTYFADWKSDRLASYDRGAIEAHVKAHYELQARIYSVGIVRLLRIRSEDEYQRRFGGLLYVFIRGVGSGATGQEGVFFRKPRWDEIVRYESGLIDEVGLR